MREGLLHILGAGISQIWRPANNQTLGVTVALHLDWEADEVGAHQLEAQVSRRGSDDLVGAAKLGINLRATDIHDPDLPLSAPIVMPIGAIQLDGPGLFEVKVLVDGETLTTLPLRCAITPVPGPAIGATE